MGGELHSIYQWESGKEYCRRVPRMGNIVVALFLKIWFTIAPDWKKTVYWIIKDTFIHYLFCVEFSSVQFSHSVMFDSFRPHALQHARPPCPSPTPRVHPNLCPCLVCLFCLLKEPAFSFIYLCIVSLSHVYPSFFFFFHSLLLNQPSF